MTGPSARLRPVLQSVGGISLGSDAPTSLPSREAPRVFAGRLVMIIWVMVVIISFIFMNIPIIIMTIVIISVMTMTPMVPVLWMPILLFCFGFSAGRAPAFWSASFWGVPTSSTGGWRLSWRISRAKLLVLLECPAIISSQQLLALWARALCRPQTLGKQTSTGGTLMGLQGIESALHNLLTYQAGHDTWQIWAANIWLGDVSSGSAGSVSSSCNKWLIFREGLLPVGHWQCEFVASAVRFACLKLVVCQVR